MPEERIKALLIEDSEADYVLITEYISRSINTLFELRRADRLSSGIEMIAHTTFDVALLDLSLPDSSGMETVTKFREQVEDVPVVVMSGLQDEDTAIQCVQEGAQDYLVKSRLSTESIVRAVKYAIQRHRIQSGIMKAKQEFDSGKFRARSGPPAEKRAAGQDPVGGATGELSLEQADIVSFANRLGIIFRTCKTADTVSATVVSLQLRGIVQSFIALEPNGGDVIAVIKKALEREGISALDMDTLPICFEFFSMVVSKYRQ